MSIRTHASEATPLPRRSSHAARPPWQLGAPLGAPAAVVPEAGPADTTVHVDPALTFQKLTGFGASLTDSSAAVLYRLDEKQREALMEELFSPQDGNGLSMLRQPIGASDFATSLYSFDDVPAGRTDYGLKHFSVGHDTKQILPLLRQAKALNPRLKVIASPWSPPAWMKTGGSMIDGKLIDDPRIYDAYARYLVKFVKAYAAHGVPVDYLTVQNEPQALLRADYPGTDLPVAQQAAVIERLGPALRKAGLRTKILGFDQNWAEHPFDVQAHVDAGDDPELNYPFDLLKSRTESGSPGPRSTATTVTGATRIAASVAAAEGDTAAVQASAFMNPDGSTALVLHNPSTTVAHTTTISAPGVHVTTKVAPDSTVTYTWARP
ncbi:glycoside hydrolase family 30 protein [Streptomyces sp. NPDC091265]|uniref:glycoside hydrolase family 30 protein n=1 Tax=unclassified Streptomyces TaxID=2593676 RepID=UPI00344D00C0